MIKSCINEQSYIITGIILFSDDKRSKNISPSEGKNFLIAFGGGGYSKEF